MTKRKTNKQKKSTANVRKAVARLAIAKRDIPPVTPFADAGAVAGAGLGQMFGLPFLKGVGKFLGSGIGSIFGSGDYQMIGNQPKYNLLMNGAQIPKFSSEKATNIISHREYLGDITGTANFTNRQYPLNPGMAETFPWLATIAQNYQEYWFHGIIFEFRPLITDFVTSGAPGVVIMATNYNADAPVYNTKQEMENSEFAVSVKPTNSLIHGIECAHSQTILPQRYIRTGAVTSGQDLRLYDVGNFQFASQSNPVQNLGELWVSYTVEFFKPILPRDVGGNVRSGHAVRSVIAATEPLGTTTLINEGTLTLSFTNTAVSWTAQPGNAYLVELCWFGGSTALTNPVLSISGGSFTAEFNNGSQSSAFAPNTGVTATSMIASVLIRSTLVTTGTMTLTCGTAGAFPSATNSLDVYVTTVSDTLIN